MQQHNPFEVTNRDRKIRSLVYAARQSRLTVDQAAGMTKYQWGLLAEIASRLLNQKVEPPGSQQTIDAIVAQMRVDERIASRSLDDLIANFKKRDRRTGLNA